MRYFKKVTKPSKKGEYIQIYYTFYTKEKGSRNKCYQSLGYVSDMKANGIEDPYKYADDLILKLNEENELNKEAKIGEVSLIKNVGYFIIKSMLDYIDMDKDINLISSQYKSDYKMSDFLRALTYGQVVAPGSKSKLCNEVLPNLFNCDTYSYSQVLDGIERVGENYHRYLEVMNHHIEKKWPRKLDKLYFDCTNYYFEIDLEDDLRRKGPSKENRRSPLIGQALLLDGEMIPLDMELYPGNECEKPYLRKRIEDMKTKNGIKGRIIQIADKGLNCARNIYAAVKEANDGYIFSRSVHGTSISNIDRKWITSIDDGVNRWTEIKHQDGRLKYRFKVLKGLENGKVVDYDVFPYKFKDGDGKEIKFSVKEKRVVYYNPALARKKKEEIKKEVAKLRNKMTYKEAVKEEFGDAIKYATLKTVNQNGEKVKVVISINEDKVNEDLELAGYNMIVTSELNADPIDIYNAYHRLWKIEESFRINKTILEAQPIYVSKENLIYGHFYIVYMALTMLRLLEIKMFNEEISVSALVNNFIRKYEVVDGGNGSYINCSSSCQELTYLKKKLGLSKIDNVYLKKKDIINMLNYEF